MTASFDDLHPDRVLSLVEDVLHTRADSVCRPLTSYVNRVFEVHLDNGQAVIAKFYRPGRWSPEALDEEHAFMFELAEEDVPVVEPLTDPDGYSLFEDCGVWFSLSPRRRGRPFEDPDDHTWQHLGRTLARMHRVGDADIPQHRLEWHPETATRTHLDFILHHANGDHDFRRQYQLEVDSLIHLLSPLFDDLDFTRIHGDMHAANIMSRPDQDDFILIDFDDMVYGPPVQDLWMLLPDTVENCPREIDHLLHGYLQIREFPRNSLSLVEPLRAMRFIHFTAWCALQQHDLAANRLAENFDAPSWWRQELAALKDQHHRIRELLHL